MKKLFLTTMVCVAFLNITNAQTESNSQTPNPSVGIKGGLNFTNLYTEDVDDNNILTSFNLGLYANLPTHHQSQFNLSLISLEKVLN